MNKCPPMGNARLREESWLVIFEKIKETLIRTKNYVVLRLRGTLNRYKTRNKKCYGSVNFKSAHPPGHLSGFLVILSVPAVGNLSGNLCPSVGHFSILLEAVYIVSFYLQICPFR